MKQILAIIFLLIVLHDSGQGQNSVNYDSTRKQQYDGIMHKLNSAKEDTSRVLLLDALANYYKDDRPDSSLFYGYKALALAREIKFPKGEIESMRWIILSYIRLGNDSKAFQINLQAQTLAQRNHLPDEKARLHVEMGAIYVGLKNYSKALESFREAKILFDSLKNFSLSALAQALLGETFLNMDQPDSALYYCQSAYENAVRLKAVWVEQPALVSLGRAQNKKGNIDKALAYYWQALSKVQSVGSAFSTYSSLAQLYNQINQPDSSIYYAKMSLDMAQKIGSYPNIIAADTLLSAVYEKSNPQKALQYSKVAIAYKDSLYNLGKTSSVQNVMAFDEQERQYEIKTANAAYRNQIKQYLLIAGSTIFLIIAFILYRNNRQKQKANIALQEQKEKVETTLKDLKSTQSQLIQQEKMASLGELTAGIAHEIQNPLNFVNNFSEVNKEMLEDLKAERLKPKAERDEQTEDEILADVIANEEKINHHGKRADAIVKGMLQHSRSSSGVKELTDINKLADEYLWLSYHGFKAKDKNFNAEIKTHFDKTIEKINIIPQDIGRVLLNLYNNAFYAVNEQKSKNLISYEPTVSVTTKKSGNSVLITVSDNGGGISEKIKEKIFQPFFTTKPTGSATGLGLSLSYDIVKAHGGELKVKTREGEGSEFIVWLPII